MVFQMRPKLHKVEWSTSGISMKTLLSHFYLSVGEKLSSSTVDSTFGVVRLSHLVTAIAKDLNTASSHIGTCGVTSRWYWGGSTQLQDLCSKQSHRDLQSCTTTTVEVRRHITKSSRPHLQGVISTTVDGLHTLVARS